MQLLGLKHLEPARHIAQNTHTNLGAGKHELPEKILFQINHGAGFEDGNDHFGVLTCQQGDFAEGFSRTDGANQYQVAVFLDLLQPELAVQQYPETATRLVDLVEVGARLGMDQLRSAEAPKVLDRYAGKYRHFLQLLGEARDLDHFHLRTLLNVGHVVCV